MSPAFSSREKPYSGETPSHLGLTYHSTPTHRVLCGGLQIWRPSLTKLLANDVTAWADGGSKVRASLYPVSGQEIVAKRFISLMHRVPADTLLFIEEINGAPAILFWSGGHPNWVQTLDIRDNVIVGLYTLVNPDKLAFLQRQLESRSEPFLLSSQILP